MSISDKRKEYIYQYQREKLKRIPLDVPKDNYERIKAHSEAQGESVNGFIKRLYLKPWSGRKVIHLQKILIF